MNMLYRLMNLEAVQLSCTFGFIGFNYMSNMFVYSVSILGTGKIIFSSNYTIYSGSFTTPSVNEIQSMYLTERVHRNVPDVFICCYLIESDRDSN
jgi:hypothetical protein